MDHIFEAGGPDKRFRMRIPRGEEFRDRLLQVLDAARRSRPEFTSKRVPRDWQSSAHHGAQLAEYGS